MSWKIVQGMHGDGSSRGVMETVQKLVLLSWNEANVIEIASESEK